MKQVSYQLPPDNGGIVDLGAKLFKKKVLPYREISYQGGKLSINRQIAEKIVQSFKRGAFEIVPLVLGGHSDDPAKTGGRVKTLSAEEDGLYATIETNPAGEEAVRRNFDALPVSVRYLSDYRRESDGVRFGPTLAHIASTFSPRMVGMGGWQAVEASTELGRVVDLSESGWDSEDGPGGYAEFSTLSEKERESWMSPRPVDLAETSAEDADFIKRAECYAFEHEMSWSEATRHVPRYTNR